MKPEFIDKLPDLDICLMGLQGSRMLGLAQSEDADYDYRGIFVVRNSDLLGLQKPVDTIEGGSYGDGAIEWVFHEVEKFFRLAMKGNPSVIHLFFCPKYNYINDIGQMILANKDLFLNEPSIRASFGGYAMSQMLYLKRNRGNAKRREKHVRHCFRLFDSGKELLETGTMTFPLTNAQEYIDLGKKLNEPGGLDEIIRLFEEKDKEFRACKSVLPKESSISLINGLLLQIRDV